MSIVGYSGLPGSGKSYGVVENVIIPALEAGRHVMTNIPLKTGRLSDDFPKGRVTIFNNKDAEDDPEFFNLDDHPGGVIWVIDEAWRFWKSGMKSVHIPEKQKEFFTEHRHVVGDDGRTNEIVLVTQDLSQLCIFVRGLIEETFRAVKLTAIGQSNKYRIDVYMGAAQGQKPGKPLRQLYGSYKPEIYQYYRSHTRNKTDFVAGMEEKADDRANVLKHPLIRFGMPFALVVGIFGVYRMYNYFQSDPLDEPQPQVSQNPPISTAPVQSSNPRTNAQPPRQSIHQVAHEIETDWLPISDQWRIVGEVNGVYWIWGDAGTRKIHSRICATTLNTGEPYCVIGGKRVTFYSFREPSRDVPNDESRGYELKLGSDGA
ncbi:hypothetical protein C7H09_06445 [Marinobacter fuscus]|uniref:Zona occludens toxin N-terminal domain-containing protein n=1 Tax=Marinobacter fuscus TaxID=2109942 RepID=A0A2T1KKA9_9GAMM|nr:zonular occludens toxin domain-containing protein [Marinobacter fuscus]PSF10579.1 hypothetical protein C7H09_06445 [Marinobacter fuscus]